MTEIFSDTSFRQLSQMLLSIIFFHTSEYILAISFHGASNVTLNSLLISKHYAIAMLMALLEYLIEITYFPWLKQNWWVSNFGIIMIIIGEIIRKTAIITAGRSFTHLIKINHEEHHGLVTHGVYRLMRHPSYCGFLIWSVGTQVMLCNPISTVMFMVVVWRFFAQRIPYEEHFLKQFFGVEYLEYAESVASGVPFVKWNLNQFWTWVLFITQSHKQMLLILEYMKRSLWKRRFWRGYKIYHSFNCLSDTCHRWCLAPAESFGEQILRVWEVESETMLCGGSRASVHMWDHRHPTTLGAKVFRQSLVVLRPCTATLLPRMKSSSRSHCKTPGQIPVPHDCFRFLNLAVVVFFSFQRLKSVCLMWNLHISA